MGFGKLTGVFNHKRALSTRIRRSAIISIRISGNANKETYRILYARNLLLYNELTDARKTIERLNALLHA